jgi:hypothetical protein
MQSSGQPNKTIFTARVNTKPMPKHPSCRGGGAARCTKETKQFFFINKQNKPKKKKKNLGRHNTSHHLTNKEGDQGRTDCIPVQRENHQKKKRCRGNGHGGRPHSQKKMTGNVELGFRKEGVGGSKAAMWNPCVPALVFKLF